MVDSSDPVECEVAASSYDKTPTMQSEEAARVAIVTPGRKQSYVS